jgi:hypothetical protein
MSTPRAYIPAFTMRSLIASVLAMLGTATAINYVHVVLLAHSPGEHALIVPGLWVFMALLGVSGLFGLVFRLRLLSRAEWLCVLYTILLSGPMMSQGFWHRIVSISGTIPRTGDFAKMDAFSDKLWPAGGNLLAGRGFQPGDGIALTGNYAHVVVDHTLRDKDEIVALSNAGPLDSAAIRYHLPLRDGRRPGVMPGTPYLISMLIRPENLGGTSAYFVRIYPDDSGRYDEPLRSRVLRPPSVIHPHGFQREGLYAYQMPADIAADGVVIEFGLEGEGTLYLADPQLRSVMALEQVFSGRRQVSATEYEALPEALRHGLVVRPNSLWSLAGARYLLSGYIPWSDWWRPLLAWGSFLVLLLTGTLSLAVLMRRKWIDSERYALPLTRVVTALIGEPDTPDLGARNPFWRNRIMWMGFAISLTWCLLKVFSFYYPNVPDPGIEVNLAPYFGPEWGDTWNINFTVFALFLSLAIFVELNILVSFVIGFFLFRLLYWYGHVSGMDALPGFPYAQEQQIGGYIAYAALVLLFSRRYLMGVFRQAVKGQAADHGELFSYRTALCLLAGVLFGSAVWARWIEVSVGGMLLFMTFLLCIGFVAMKIRAECGVPYGYFTPNNAALLIMVTGGIGVFGPSFVLLTFVASFFVTVTVLMLIPGAQLEIIELGRRYGIQPRHILYTALLGIVGGILIGGWSFLSTSYALGGDNLRYFWAYDAKAWYFADFNRALATASGGPGGSSGWETSTFGYLWGAGGAVLLTVLRQLFAGFWLHPLGFILGSTHMMGGNWVALWGSMLTAWLIRLLVVKIGGAETVRAKLIPFFIGFFIAAVLANLLVVLHATYLRAQGVELIFSKIL